MNKIKPYQPCVGRKYRAVPKLYRPFTILIGGVFCHDYFISKNRIRFIKQILRWFYKSRWGYILTFCIDLKKNLIREGDLIMLSCRTQKAAFRKLLSKLNFELSDYTVLKRRKYSLNFIFLFFNVSNIINPNIFLDISSKIEDSFNIFIITNGFYIENFYNMLYYNETFIVNIPKKFYYNILNELDDFSFNFYYIQFINFNLLELIEENKKKKDKN